MGIRKKMLIGYTSDGKPKISETSIEENDYLAISPIWKSLREKRLQKDFFRCSNPNCTNVNWLEIHHINYPEFWGLETIDDIVTLCHQCHAAVHKK